MMGWQSWNVAALVLATGMLVAADARACEVCVAKERELFASLGRTELPRRVWWTPDEALAELERDEKDLAQLRESGSPNPRAEERLRELRDVILGRQEGDGVLKQRSVDKRVDPNPAQVFVSSYMNEVGPTYHREECPKLKGIISPLARSAVPKELTACTVCFRPRHPGDTPDPGGPPPAEGAVQRKPERDGLQSVDTFQAARKEEAQRFDEIAAGVRASAAAKAKEKDQAYWERSAAAHAAEEAARRAVPDRFGNPQGRAGARLGLAGNAENPMTPEALEQLAAAPQAGGGRVGGSPMNSMRAAASSGAPRSSGSSMSSGGGGRC